MSVAVHVTYFVLLSACTVTGEVEVHEIVGVNPELSETCGLLNVNDWLALVAFTDMFAGHVIDGAAAATKKHATEHPRAKGKAK